MDEVDTQTQTIMTRVIDGVHALNTFKIDRDEGYAVNI